ncbi:hypothetical protein MCUN1_002070 [Malassezia cuniculi]|uniref:Uncharacterized protein n=1 Tax=Malassezia cuniculi TaxID=948313 RepID=A0AAF0J6M6_9BASI|nr:hypothetical protein MCUN1_002070 [Malassezia cuniculi]
MEDDAMSPPPDGRAWPSTSDEAEALRELRRRIVNVEGRGTAQLAIQQDVLALIEAEQVAIDDALQRIASAERREAYDSEMVVGKTREGEAAQHTFAPLLTAAHISAIPILQAHAVERRNLRTLLSAPQWSSDDVDHLQQSVRSEHIRLSTLLPKCDTSDPDAVDWTRVAMNVPFHTPADCRTRWRLVERPETNMGRWTGLEKKQLAEYMSRAPENVSWEKVAKSLGTRRLGYQALEAYQQGIRPHIEWTKELDAALLAAVQQHGPDWKAVALHIGLHPGSALSCHQRHTLLKSTKLVQGRWSAEEDAALRAAVAEYGCDWKRSWVEVAKFVGGRSDKMVRERWLLLKRRDEDDHRRRRGEHK